MSIKIVQHDGLFTAEVTPPHGDGRPWSSPRPMQIGELVAALKAIGCLQPDISVAVQEAALRQYRELAESISPRVRAVLSGESEVPAQSPFTETWLTLALFLGYKPLPLAEVIDGADFIWHAVPNPDQIAWALLQLKKRGWLVLQGSSYGLTQEAKRTIEEVVGNREGGVLKGVERLKAWVLAHPPPAAA